MFNNSWVLNLWVVMRSTFAATGLLILLISCSNDSTQESEKNQAVVEQAAPKTIALVMKTLTNPFFVEMERGARRAEKELGINLVVKTAAQETSIQQQIGIVEKLIQEKINAIVIAPGDSVELIPVLKQAQDAGIVVVNIDNRLDPEYSKVSGLNNVPFISVDNEQAAYLSAKTLTARMEKPTLVAILEGIRGAGNAEDRKNGAVRAFEEEDKASIVAMDTANWKIDEAFSVTERLLKTHPDIGAIFCANDMMALGTIQYLKSAGRSDVMVAGYDALDEAIDEVRAGGLVTTVDQQAAEQGYQGVLFAVKLLNGEKMPALKLIDTRIITKDSLN
jgi:ribose transport system substrate-binding protein